MNATETLQRQRQQQPSQFVWDQPQEQRALAEGNIELEPILQQILKRFGLLGMMRNRVIEPMVGGQGQGQPPSPGPYDFQ